MGGLWGERFAHPKGRAEEKAEDAPEKALMPGRAKSLWSHGSLAGVAALYFLQGR